MRFTPPEYGDPNLTAPNLAVGRRKAFNIRKLRLWPAPTVILLSIGNIQQSGLDELVWTSCTAADMFEYNAPHLYM